MDSGIVFLIFILARGHRGFLGIADDKMEAWIVNPMTPQRRFSSGRGVSMFEKIAQAILSKQQKKREQTLHTETLDAYKSGKYPTRPTIGLGKAILDGLLEPKIICLYAWTEEALCEGPVYLEAWRKASAGMGTIGKLKRYPYSVQNILSVAMSFHSTKWKQGWRQQPENTTTSPAMALVQWLHDADPHWIGSNLDSIVQSSGMSIWDSLLYQDTPTSKWAMEKWPDKLEHHEFPWRDWLSYTTPWMYPILKNSGSMPTAEWIEVASHLSAWSPLKNMEELDQLRRAIHLLCHPNKNIRPHECRSRGLLWKALTNKVPAALADPIGAALACAWPGMDPDCAAVRRHFYPNLGTLPMEDTALRSPTLGFHAQACMPSGASATVFLYDSPQTWVHAVINSWENNSRGNGGDTIELPCNLLD